MSITESSKTFLGKCNFRGTDKIFGIKQKDRRQHMYVIGQTGTGKTTLIENMALQDIHAGRGIGIIDPHGEFVERILTQIPKERAEDVIYFNPVDSEYPIGFNVLEVTDPQYKHLVVSDLLGIFTKIWANVWSARMEYILQNCIMALLDTPGTTLLGIPRLLVDKDYRQRIVANVKDPVVKSFWVHEYETWRDQFRNEAIVPVQNKVNQFLNTSFIRNIVGQPKSTLNIPQIMNQGKILLVNVSKGRVGEDNSQLLGAMIITKIQLAAMERVRILEEERNDFYLYVDEFQNFATESFASILSEARKYRLDLIIAHQYIGQLVTDVSTKVRDAVFGNVGTMITFRVGAADAEFLEKEFMPEFMPQDLINLPNHNVYLKLMVDGVHSRPFSATTLPKLQFEVEEGIDIKIIEQSRQNYAIPRAEVEENIAQWSGMGGETGAGGSDSGGKTFETQCWNCGKTATVPFKPDGRRPVYCQTCLRQIEEGRLIPLPERMPQSGPARFAGSLGELGIEFDQEKSEVRGQDRRGFGKEDLRYSKRPLPPESRPPGQSFRQPFPQRVVPPRRPMQSQTPPPQRRDQRGGIRSEFVVRSPKGVRRMSLSELKSPDQENKDSDEEKKDLENGFDRRSAPPQNQTSNLSDLRKALEDALSEREDNNTAQDEINKKSDDSKDENIIKPGDTVSF